MRPPKSEHTKLMALESIDDQWAYTYELSPSLNSVGQRNTQVPRDSYTIDFTTLTSLQGNRKSPTPYSFVHTRGQALTGTRTSTTDITEYVPGYGSCRTFVERRCSGPLPDFVSGRDFMSKDVAFNKALDKLYEQLRGSVDLSIDLAESGSTYRMIRTAAKMERYVKGFSRKTLANNWLEFTYGWKPLANTLYEAIGQAQSRAKALLVLTSQASDSEYREYITKPKGWIYSERVTQKCRVRLHLKYAPSNPTLDLASRYTSLNPLSIAWELVPYSFVVDWVYDVGGYLRNMETAMTTVGKITDSYQTTGWKNEIVGRKTTTGQADSNGSVWQTGDYSGKTVQTFGVRSILMAAPLPRAPTFKVQLGSTRLLSAASLLAQFLPNKERTRVPKKRILEKNFSNFVNKTWRDRNRKQVK